MAKDGYCPASDASMPTTVTVLVFLGLFFVVYLLARILYALWRGFYTCYLGRWLGHNVDFRKMGEWAVVTGASDGIGRAYCEELAARGLNIVLISRTLEKLEAVARDIEEASNVKTKVIAVDFTAGNEIYDTIRRELQGLEVGVLVNNVGVSYVYPEFFSAVPDGDKVMDSIIRANCVAGTMMTRICLPQMDQRRRGVIINVSSISAMHPLPLLSTYAASKAYTDYLSQGLHAEYKDRGIYIQSVMPAYVSTKMSKIRKATYMVPTATTYVREALNTVGIEHATYGYGPHKFRALVQRKLMECLPHSVFMNISQASLLQIRKLYYKKKGLEDTFLAKRIPAGAAAGDGAQQVKSQ
uniref:Putative 17 beta-hydroxysteroid dehydrogenase type 3 n=1 Tax=Amblyomma triste TaxID=251400 RepID=A0A023GE40_AMBTT